MISLNKGFLCAIALGISVQASQAQPETLRFVVDTDTVYILADYNIRYYHSFYVEQNGVKGVGSVNGFGGQHGHGPFWDRHQAQNAPR